MKKNGKILLTTLSILLGTSALVGCDDPVTPPSEVTVTFSAIVLGDTATTINFGGEKQLTATVTASAETYSEKIAWSSSNTAVATVSDSGKVTAVSAGTAVITASIGGVSATCNVTVLEKVPEYTFVGLTPKESFTVSKNNKGVQTNKEEEFNDKNKPYMVGTDNAISVLPDLKLIDIDTFTDYSNATGSIEKWNKDFVYAVKKVDGTNKTDAPATDFEIKDNRAGKIQFKDSAIGNTYEIKVTAGGLTATQADKQSAYVTYEVKVVKGYNVYNAKELGYVDQRPSGTVEGRPGDVDGLKPAWDEFKIANGLDVNYTPSCLVFQDNIKITTADIPAAFCYTADELKNSNDDKSIGSLKDYAEIYRYFGKTSADGLGSIENELKIYGNYFTMDASTLPLVKREVGAMSEVGGVISHSSLFKIMLGSLKLEDLKIRGNAKRAINNDDKVYGGGLIMFKQDGGTKTIETDNLISRQCFITYFGEVADDTNPYTPEFVINKCKSYDNYNSFVYNWGGKVTAFNSHFGMCGGPVLIADHCGFSGDTESLTPEQLTYEVYGKAPESTFTDCTFDNYVAGSEAWFAQMGATGITPLIKGMGDLFAEFGMTFVTNKDKSACLSTAENTVTMFNFIALNKVAGSSLEEVQKPASGSVRIVETGKSDTNYNYIAPDKAKVDGAKEIMTELLRVQALPDDQKQTAIPGLVALATKYNVSWNDKTYYSDLPTNLQDYCQSVGISELTGHAILRGANKAGAPVFQAGNNFVSYDGAHPYLQDMSNVATWTGSTPNFDKISSSHGFVSSQPTTTALYYSGMLLVFGVSYFVK